MSDKELVIAFVSKLPEEISLAEISRRIDFLAGVKAAEADAERGKIVAVAEARSLVDHWARQ